LHYQMRLATVSDINFIKNSWIKSSLHTFPNMFQMDYVETIVPIIDILIDRCQSLVLFAEDNGEILHWIVYEEKFKRAVIHFAYTKVDARRKGLLKHSISILNPNNSHIIFTFAAKNVAAMKMFASKYTFDARLVVGTPIL
jgi:hypothetical protein